MKFLLVSLNAKYIHSSLALHSIKSYCKDYAEYIDIFEFTINNDDDFIVSEIYSLKPNLIAFSCYIWNIHKILNISRTLKKLLPDSKIVLGGPEVSYDIESLMESNPHIDIVIYGEGEFVFLEIIKSIMDRDFSYIHGIAYRLNSQICINSKPQALDLDSIDFVYNDENIECFKNKIIYYETSRGCPYNCQYCLSSIEKGVRFLSLERVYSDLKFFLSKNIKQVKFVDRTFNCDRHRALNIWKFIKENDNGITNFHFEITADLIDNETIEFLKTVRKGLFQFEIGVQSTNSDTIEAIDRNVNFKLLSEIVKKIKSFKNIHQHLDLIAGLPKENYASFQKSFDDVYKLEPEQLQLGFLKLLKGSGLRQKANDYGIVYKDTAPYEVLYTEALSYAEIIKLKYIEQMVEIYYNSGRAINTLKYIIQFFKSPFLFYQSLAEYWKSNNHHMVQHNKIEFLTILKDFCAENIPNEIEVIKQILKFDIFLNENLKTLPEWMDSNTDYSYKKLFYADSNNIQKYFSNISYNRKQIEKLSHIEHFKYDIVSFLDTGTMNASEITILFIYSKNGIKHSNVDFYKIQ